MSTLQKTIAAICVLMLLAATAVAGVPLLLSHQGRLLDASDQPINGTLTITFSIYDVPTAGSPLWTEDHPGVVVTNGLFTAELGTTVPLSADILTGSGGGGGGGAVRYLQVQISGEPPIAPRLRLGSAPYSVASSRVSGDIETAPGSISINDGSHDRAIIKSLGSVTYVGTWDVSNNNSSKLYTDTDSAGLAVRIDDHDLLGLRVNKGINTPIPYTNLHLSDVSGKGLSSLTCTADSVVESKSLQVNPTTVHEVAGDCDDAGSRLGVKVSSTGAWSGGASMSTTRNVSTDIDCDVDANGNGHSERNMRERINALESRLSLASDIDDDGLSDLEVSSATGPDTALMTVTSKDASQKKGEANIAALLNGSTVIGCMTHTDGSGVADNGCTLTSNDLGASSKTSAGKGFYYVVSNASSSPAVDASLHVVADANGNGHAERSIWQKVDNSEALSSATVDINDDGVPDVGTEISAKVPRSVLKTYFESGDKPTASQFRAVSDSGGASSTVEVDLNHDSNPDGGSSMDAEETRSELKTYFETGEVPTQDNIVQSDCDPNGASFALRHPTALLTWGTGMSFRVDSSGQSISMDQDSLPTFSVKSNATSTEARLSKAIADGDTKLTMSAGSSDCHIQLGDLNRDGFAELTTSSGSNPLVPQSASLRLGRPAVNTAIFATDEASASIELSHASSGVGDKPTSAQFGTLIDSYIHLQDDGLTRCALESSTGLQLRDQFNNLTASISTEGTSYFSAKVGIGVTSPSHPLEVSGGAYCDGTNWVNASDANSKENFESVNGEELLQRLAQLPISEWNYKTECDGVKHIGPTAQDFKAVFGVGSDGKSISTIDPSGIALAAIKELTKKNAELTTKLEKLQALVDKMAQREAARETQGNNAQEAGK